MQQNISQFNQLSIYIVYRSSYYCIVIIDAR